MNEYEYMIFINVDISDRIIFPISIPNVFPECNNSDNSPPLRLGSRCFLPSSEFS